MVGHFFRAIVIDTRDENVLVPCRVHVDVVETSPEGGDDSAMRQTTNHSGRHGCVHAKHSIGFGKGFDQTGFILPGNLLDSDACQYRPLDRKIVAVRGVSDGYKVRHLTVSP